MKYHALFVMFEKRQNLQLSSAEIIGAKLRVKDFLRMIKHQCKQLFYNQQNHVKEADDVLNAIRDIPGSKVKGRYWDYRDFLEEMETQFK